ncbi:hypothetical protein HQQ81_21290 [Microbacteriaceae bacterium VKM Ac-2854]|nr:hypothetical protein [Microbacteriaceae bacterium VKM Ac-2854]
MLRFIRYIGTRDGWVPEILHGRFVEGTETGWRIDVEGIRRDLDESEWAPYQP